MAASVASAADARAEPDDSPTAPTVRELTVKAAGWLEGQVPDSPRLDAELLLAWAMGGRRLDLYMDPDRRPTSDELDRFREAVKDRASGMPVAYLTGTREFWGLAFHVTPAVLVPRPETESVLEAALEGGVDGLAAADVGTGSGCLAVVLALKGARVAAVDASVPALRVAARNVAAHGVGDRVLLVQGSGPSGVGPVDLVVTNPPYIDPDDPAGLDPAVARTEPADALFAQGGDGLSHVRSWAALSMQALRPGGRFVSEFGDGQDEAAAEAVRAAGMADVRIRSDAAGRPRVVVGRRAP